MFAIIAMSAKTGRQDRYEGRLAFLESYLSLVCVFAETEIIDESTMKGAKTSRYWNLRS